MRVSEVVPCQGFPHSVEGSLLRIRYKTRAFENPSDGRNSHLSLKDALYNRAEGSDSRNPPTYCF